MLNYIKQKNGISLKMRCGKIIIFISVALYIILFGEEHFLIGVVVSQTIIAVLCLAIYLDWYRRRFQPGTIAILLTAAVCIVPLTLDFPDVLINHCILTEALAYPLFYVFAIACAELMIRKRKFWRQFLR